MVRAPGTGHVVTQSRQPMQSALTKGLALLGSMPTGQGLLQRLQSVQAAEDRRMRIRLNRPTTLSTAPRGHR